MLHYLVRKQKTAEPTHTLVILHGYGADEYDLLSIAEYLPPSLQVISLRAPITLPWGGYAWYHLEQTPEGLHGDEASRKESEELLKSVLPQLMNKENAVSNNVLLMGFSQGAAMSLALVANTADISIKGLIVLSGYMPKETKEAFIGKKLEGLPVFISHGEFDDLISPTALEETASTLADCGATITSKLYPMGHSISQEVIDDLNRWFTESIFKTE